MYYAAFNGLLTRTPLHQGIQKLFLRRSKTFANNPMKRFFLMCMLVCCIQGSTWAQQVVFSAEASANTVGIEDQFQVSFTLENIQDIQGIQQPKFNGFRILGGPYQSRSSNISFNGNQTVQTTSLSLTYVLQATQVGELSIAPISAKDGQGKTYQSNPLKIKVVKGSLAQNQRRQQQSQDPFGDWDPFADDPFFGGGADPFAMMRQHQQQMQQLMQQLQQMQQGAPSMGNASSLPSVSEKELGKNVFIKVTVDKTKVKVGEQITATYKMYARIPMQAQLSKLPSLNGFWTQDFELPKDPKPQTETLDGVQYQCFTLKKSALFPQQSGTLILDPAEANGVARIADRANPYGRDVQFKLKSSQVSITVSPLPIEGQPEDFGGAVGEFSLKTAVDKQELSTDESINLSIDISGTGNLKLIQAPKLKLPNGLDAYEPNIVDTITSRSTTISGHKIFNYAITAIVAGDYTIPPISFSFYNIKTGKYVTLQSQSIKLQVRQGKGLTKSTQSVQKQADIHPISLNKLTPLSAARPWIYSSWYWLLYATAAVSILLLAIWKKKQQEDAANIGLVKKKQANKIALKRLKSAKSHLTNKEHSAFYEEISKAIWLYLSDKLNIPLSQLSKESAATALTDKNVPHRLLDQMNELIEHCAMALYAPSSGSQPMHNIYEQTAELISELEDKLKK